MLKVVADTNVLISALMFGGLPGIFLNLAFAGNFQLVTSPPLLSELDEKLRIKFKLSNEDADLVRAKLEANAFVVQPAFVLQVVAEDPDDDRVLECAITGQSNQIVSGDRHLLKLRMYGGIIISTVREFMDTAGLGDLTL